MNEEIFPWLNILEEGLPLEKSFYKFARKVKYENLGGNFKDYLASPGFYLYIFINKINGKLYGGQTVNLKNRIKNYAYDAKNKKTMPIAKAIAKYGFENFELFIIKKYENTEQLNINEQILIKYIKNHFSNYNICDGGTARMPSTNFRSGLENPCSKLTKHEINNIFIDYHKNNLTTKKLAAKYNISPTSIKKLLKGVSYQDITQKLINEFGHIKSNKDYSKPFGEENSKSKLTKKEVIQIIHEYFAGKNITTLSKDFNVRRGTIRFILEGRNWLKVTKLTLESYINHKKSIYKNNQYYLK